MAYRLLLFGNNTSAIGDIYAHTNIKVELMTASTRFDDMIAHLKYYNPNALVYCMGDDEPAAIYQIMSTVKKEHLKPDVPFIGIASSAVRDELKKSYPYLTDLMLVRPITGRQIISEIVSYLEKQELLETAPPVPPEDETKETAQKAAGDSASDQEFLDKLTEELLIAPTAKHILVIDDDPRMLKVIKRHLEDDYEVATAVNGKVALKFLQTKSADLILLDYEMPIQNGPAVLSELRSNPKTENIPVVFLTGINDRDKIRTALSMRPQGYLLKPIERKKLMETIHGILG